MNAVCLTALWLSAAALAADGASEKPSRPYAMWTESSMRRIMPATRPETVPERPRHELSLARGEYESFQIGLLADGAPVEDVRLEARDLVQVDGQARIPSEEIEWRQVGYVWIETLDAPWVKANIGAVADSEVPGWWPDPLLPVSSFDLEPDFAQAVWVTVHAPPGTPAGRYRGEVVVHAEGAAPAPARLEVRVFDFEIAPGAGHFRTAFAFHEQLIENIYGEPATVRQRRQFHDFALQHRLDSVNIYRSTPPDVADLEHYLEGGMNCYPVLTVTRKGRPTDEYRRLLSDFMQELAGSEHADELRRMAYVYGFDEVDPDKFELMREQFGVIRDEFGVPTMTTGHVPLETQTLDDLNIDWLCPILHVFTGKGMYEQAQRVRDTAHEVWSYVSLQPYPPFPNWRMDNPLVEARAIWWIAHHQQFDGFLYWHLNAWYRPGNDRPIDPEADGPRLEWSITTAPSHPWLHGDGMLIYPGVDGPIGCIRLANIRDGLEDWEYLWLLAQREGVEAAREACQVVTRAPNDYTRDPDVLAARRRAIARRIER